MAKLRSQDERAISKLELKRRIEAVTEAFESYCETLEGEEYELFYDAINDVLALAD